MNLRLRTTAFGLATAMVAAISQAATIEVRVTQGTDDAEEILTQDNQVDVHSSDLELGGEDGELHEVGIRFDGVQIPPGAVIEDASIQFTVDEADDVETSVTIFGEMAEEPATFDSEVAGNVSDRMKTSNSVNWDNIPPWNNEHEAGIDQQTPDLSPILQELIGQPTWKENGSLSFIISPTPGGQRTAESFDGEATMAPLLRVSFVLVPEPCSLVLLGLGLFLTTTMCRFRRRR